MNNILLSFSGYLAEMKPNFACALSLNDIAVFEEEIEDGQTDNDMGRGQEGGGVALIQLGRRSRKRRSFMETNFTSRVTFPEPGVVSNQTLSSTRIQRALLPQDSGIQHLNVDPEASDQSQNICPTVASLTHSEGEPALLESKPIPSKSRPRRPGSPKDSGSLDSDRDPCAASRRQKQEMEMEPDAMESKPVTDLVKLASPSITVVRCRVEPDGKESADRRGDGKEEGEEEGKVEEGERTVEREEDGDKQELIKLSQNGPLFGHYRQLSEIIEETYKCEEAGDELYEREWGIVRESFNSAETLKEDNPIQSDVLGDDFPTQLPPATNLTPPLSPNSSLPPLPVVNKTQNLHVSLTQKVGIKDMQVYSSEVPKLKFPNREQYIEVSTITKQDETSSTSNSGTISDDVFVKSDNDDDDEDGDDGGDDDDDDDDDDF